MSFGSKKDPSRPRPSNASPQISSSPPPNAPYPERERTRDLDGFGASLITGSLPDEDPTVGASELETSDNLDATQPVEPVSAPRRSRTLPDAGVAKFGPYLVFEERGGGGMADVRRARRRMPDGVDQTFALKRLRKYLKSDPEHRRMFREEMRTAARLSHPNIVRVLDAGEIEGTPYIAFELVDGLPASKLLSRARSSGLPVAVCLEIGRRLAAALDYAHNLVLPTGERLNLVHRDVSPDNILIGLDGSVKLTDFGIVRHDERDFETLTNVVKGKVPYMSPEALLSRSVTSATDVFSLGLVVGELLSSSALVPPSPLGALAIEDWPRWVERAIPGRRRDVPEVVVRLLRATLERDPRKRPSAAEVERIFTELLRPAQNRSHVLEFLRRIGVAEPAETTMTEDDEEELGEFGEEPTQG